mmetsp:Transcript_22932/g.58328  ORF Transcript_22932/g.58328 Transcript_22932/m.58328 type:complete len:215 (-) Transcript_22932:128-772(-)
MAPFTVFWRQAFVAWLLLWQGVSTLSAHWQDDVRYSGSAVHPETGLLVSEFPCEEFAKLSILDQAVTVEVHLLHELGDVVLGDRLAQVSHERLDLLLCDDSISVRIKARKCGAQRPIWVGISHLVRHERRKFPKVYGTRAIAIGQRDHVMEFLICNIFTDGMEDLAQLVLVYVPRFILVKGCKRLPKLKKLCLVDGVNYLLASLLSRAIITFEV